jgi:uncharacterized membrane protein YfcA
MLPEIVLVGALSGFVQGLSGFAFGLVATSFWAWMLAPQQVVPLVVLGSLIGQCTSILGVRRNISVGRVSPFVIGGLAGVPLGASLLQAMNAQAFRAIFGLGLILFCTLMLRAERLPKVQAGRSADGCIGFVSGTLAGACGMGGPPMTLWCSLRTWDTATQRATFQAFFIVMQIQVLALYAWHGVIDRPLMSIFLALAPAIVAASWLGSRLARRFSDRKFQRLVFLLLLGSGVMLLAPPLVRAAGALFR